MSKRSRNLCVCTHRRKKHSNGQCEDCQGSCVYKESSDKNVIKQKGTSGGSTAG